MCAKLIHTEATAMPPTEKPPARRKGGEEKKGGKANLPPEVDQIDPIYITKENTASVAVFLSFVFASACLPTDPRE